jgi:hypothetical protein
MLPSSLDIFVQSSVRATVISEPCLAVLQIAYMASRPLPSTFLWLLKNLSRRSTAFQSDMLLAEWSMF